MSRPRGGVRWVLLCAAAVAGLSACGAADEPVDPGTLELRDLLGVAPRVAVAWDDAQRAAARQVLAAGLDGSDAIALADRGPVADAPAVVAALAVLDERRLDAEQDALGLVVADRALAAVHAIDAVDAAAWLHGDAVAAPTITLELDASAWPCPAATPCDLDVLAVLAAAAAPDAVRLRVMPAPALTVIAALWTTDDGAPMLLVNPIVTAVGAPADHGTVVTTSGSARVTASAAGGAGAVPGYITRAPVIALPLVTTTWTYDPSVAACAAAVQRDCQTCLAGGLCEPIWPAVSGMEACTMLDADVRNYALLCANLALSLSDIGTCVAGRAPSSCTLDSTAIDAPATLAANARFLDDLLCADALQVCLDQFYGATDSNNACSCGSCDCGSCDCSGNSCGSNANTDSGQCGSMDNTGGCNNGGCGDSSSGGGCGGSGGGCSGSGGGGSCAVAPAPAGRSALPVVGLAWVLVPVPVGLLARRRARRRGARPTPAA